MCTNIVLGGGGGVGRGNPGKGISSFVISVTLLHFFCHVLLNVSHIVLHSLYLKDIPFS